MIKVLLIGGPADGKNIQVREGLDHVSFVIPNSGKVPTIENGDITKSGITQVHYDIKKIQGQFTTFHIGYSGGMFDHWFNKLLKGYKPNEVGK